MSFQLIESREAIHRLLFGSLDAIEHDPDNESSTHKEEGTLSSVYNTKRLGTIVRTFPFLPRPSGLSDKGKLAI